MSVQQKRIGLLGGSFDPVHNGHISIAKSFLQSDLLDELWVLLTPDPPHKTGQAQAAFQSRLKMLQTAFNDFDDVKISDVEKQLSHPSYTIQTLEHLKAEYPESTFYLCIGGDSLKHFKQWKDWQQIIQYADLLVAKRPATDNKKIDTILKDHVHFVDHEPVDISSTTIRDAIASGDDVSALIPSSVKKIIDSQKLYKSNNDE